MERDKNTLLWIIIGIIVLFLGFFFVFTLNGVCDDKSLNNKEIKIRHGMVKKEEILKKIGDEPGRYVMFGLIKSWRS
mgnify:CR=1 FL=1